MPHFAGLWRLPRAVLGLTVLLAVMGCGGNEQPTSRPEARLHKVIGCDNPDRRLDVVFLHGVDGHYEATWHPEGKPEAYWPRWLGEDVDKIGVWSLHYPAATTPFRGETMNLIDRGTSVLALLEADGFSDHPNRPLVFIAHSFGGLVTKQLLETAHDSTKDEWKAILGRSAGVVFIATPNSGLNLADYLEFLEKRLQLITITTTSVKDLRRGEPSLLKLNQWYRDHATQLGVSTLVFCEEQATYGFQVVDKESADPGISGVTPIPMDQDHMTICKPLDREAPLYKQIVRFVSKSLLPMPPPDMPDPTGAFKQGGAVNPPSAQDVDRQPNVKAEDVVLFCQNTTGRRFRLALYDWSRHYANQNGRWRFLELPLGEDVKLFEDFEGSETSPSGSTGWFSVYIVTPGNDVSSCLLTANLFIDRKPRIVVEGAGPKIRLSFDE